MNLMIAHKNIKQIKSIMLSMPMSHLHQVRVEQALSLRAHLHPATATRL